MEDPVFDETIAICFWMTLAFFIIWVGVICYEWYKAIKEGKNNRDKLSSGKERGGPRKAGE